MENTLKQKQSRVIRMHDMADRLVDKLAKQIQTEGILPWPDIATILAVACAKSVVRGHAAAPDLGSEMAQTAIRVIIKNLIMQGVTIPALEMEGWVPPTIHWGNDSQH